MTMSMEKFVLLQLWWVGCILFVAFWEYRFGRKIGRRRGYSEGHRDGKMDAFRSMHAVIKFKTASEYGKFGKPWKPS
jgi:hypothetical protein